MLGDDLLGALGAFFAVVALLLAILVVRRRFLNRSGPVVDCLVRLIDGPPAVAGAAGWHTGMARYDSDAFRWWRIFRLQLTPAVRLDRSVMRVTHRRPPAEVEHGILRPGVEVFGLERPGGTTEVALDREDVPAFLAWMESAPPRSNA